MKKTTLSLLETEHAIKYLKDTFEKMLAKKLHLTRVSAPLITKSGTGLQDDLNGIERPVSFDLITGETAQIYQSLAKWKRMALARYGFKPGTGLYTDMNAIRRDEKVDELHSYYVDQWDREKIITAKDRTMTKLQSVVKDIYAVIKKVEALVRKRYPILSPKLPSQITFFTSQELEDKYPKLTPKQREYEVAKKYKAVFISQIGDKLKSGKPHDGRAPDYDDRSLNGDIIVRHPVLKREFELSSMGIRVDKKALQQQLAKAGCTERLKFPFHKMLMEGKLPLTMGGGIGQSRLCMFYLEKEHIGQVQASIRPEEHYKKYPGIL